MDLNIHLQYNHGYKWFSKDGISVKGFVYNPQGDILENEHLILYFKEIETEFQFKEKLISTNGIFSVIIQKDANFFFAVDRTRTFPLFYSSNESGAYISDAASFVTNGIQKLSEQSIEEFLHTGFVTGADTLLKNVFQVQAGAFVIFDNEFHQAFYHLYQMNEKINQPFEIISKKLADIFFNIGKRLVKALNGRTAVIPLSGGYDSRLILSLLKKNNYENVICYTYGSALNPEIRISKKVAEKLGYRWFFIEHSKSLIDGFVNTLEFEEYYPFASNFTSSFYTQEYFAVKYLKEHKLVDENSVFIPGHTGDFISGGQLIPHLSNQNLISNILKKHYCLRKNEKSKFNNRIEREIIEALPYESFDNWNLKERQAKFIVNSNRTYEFWGYKHLLPLWDKELILFFQNVDFDLKLQQKLYIFVIFTSLFNEYHIDFYKQDLPFLMQKSLGAINRLKRILGTDPYNFKYISRLFSKDKELDIKWDNIEMNINSIQSSWYIKKISEQVEIK